MKIFYVYLAFKISIIGSFLINCNIICTTVYEFTATLFLAVSNNWTENVLNRTIVNLRMLRLFSVQSNYNWKYLTCNFIYPVMHESITMVFRAISNSWIENILNRNWVVLNEGFPGEREIWEISFFLKFYRYLPLKTTKI